MTIISYFNITINKIIITVSTFSRVVKIFIALVSHHKFLLKCFFITSVQYLLPSTMLLIKLYALSLAEYDLKGLLNLSSTYTN